MPTGSALYCPSLKIYLIEIAISLDQKNALPLTLDLSFLSNLGLFRCLKFSKYTAEVII